MWYFDSHYDINKLHINKKNIPLLFQEKYRYKEALNKKFIEP